MSGAFVPPYNIPWATFLSAVEKIAADPPSRVDRSYLGSQSGNVQTYLIAALKAFGLVDQDARPARINDFADTATRKSTMADLLGEHYPTLVALGQTKATNDELREKFGEAFPGITGESRVKAIRFFLSGMSYAELPVSDLWSSVKAPRGASARTTTPRKPTARKNNGGASGDGVSGAGNSSASGAAGYSRTVELKSGGTVTLTYNVNMMTSTQDDEDFVLGLVRQLRSYQESRSSSGAQGGEQS